MPLDPQVKEYLGKMESLRLPGFHTMPVAEARSLFSAIRAMGGTPEKVGGVRDRVSPSSIKVRAYTPIGVETGSPPLPALVFFHGGGWVLGTLDTIDGLCRRLANVSGCVVVSVDYRLSPETKFPVAVHDCYETTRFVIDAAASFGIDPDRVAVGGDSAGGNLAAAVTMLARDRGGPSIAFQVLIYPITDHSFDRPSYLEHAEGVGLSREMMVWYWDQYLARPEDGQDPLASILRAEDLSRLPPALVITAEFDVLRDEGEAYARRLIEAGVVVQLQRYDGQIHGFIQMGDTYEGAKSAIKSVGLALSQTLGRGQSVEGRRQV